MTQTPRQQLKTTLAILVAEDLDARSKLTEPVSPTWADAHFDRAESAILAVFKGLPAMQLKIGGSIADEIRNDFRRQILAELGDTNGN